MPNLDVGLFHPNRRLLRQPEGTFDLPFCGGPCLDIVTIGRQQSQLEDGLVRGAIRAKVGSQQRSSCKEVLGEKTVVEYDPFPYQTVRSVNRPLNNT